MAPARHVARADHAQSQIIDLTGADANVGSHALGEVENEPRLTRDLG